MKSQTITSKLGEVEFRKKLVEQQVDRKEIFADEFGAEGIESVLRDRMEETLNRMKRLTKTGIVLSPFVEIGAERCQRSLVLENDLSASGASLDLSFDMLRSCEHYRVLFGKQKSPLRICCDANTLPIMSNSVPFVFCYATLHHFPDPTPVITNIHRILSPGGHFFFGGESYKRLLHVNLYPGRSYAAARKSSKFRKLLDALFADDTEGNEVRHGIVENNDLSLGFWKQSMSLFAEKQAELQSLKHINSLLFSPKNPLKFLLAYALGGLISGTCRKAGTSSGAFYSITERLICPSCAKEGLEIRLVHETASYNCSRCAAIYPIVDNVIFLLAHAELKVLYPEIFSRLVAA